MRIEWNFGSASLNRLEPIKQCQFTRNSKRIGTKVDHVEMGFNVYTCQKQHGRLNDTNWPIVVNWLLSTFKTNIALCLHSMSTNFVDTLEI